MTKKGALDAIYEAHGRTQPRSRPYLTCREPTVLEIATKILVAVAPDAITKNVKRSVLAENCLDLARELLLSRNKPLTLANETIIGALFLRDDGFTEALIAPGHLPRPPLRDDQAYVSWRGEPWRDVDDAISEARDHYAEVWKKAGK